MARTDNQILERINKFVHPYTLTAEDLREAANRPGGPLQNAINAMRELIEYNEEFLLELLQKNLEKQRLAEILKRLYKHYHKGHKVHDSLDDVLDKTPNKDEAQSAIDSLNKELGSLYAALYTLNQVHIKKQTKIQNTVNQYMQANNLVLAPNTTLNQALAPIFKNFQAWMERPVPTAQSLQKIGIHIPVPMPKANQTKEQYEKEALQIDKTMDDKDTVNLAIELRPLIVRAFRNSDGSLLSIKQSVGLTNQLTQDAKLGKSQCLSVIMQFGANSATIADRIDNLKELTTALQTMKNVNGDSSIFSPTPFKMTPRPKGSSLS